MVVWSATGWMGSMDPIDPVGPIDSINSTNSIDSIDSVDSIDSIGSVDSVDSMDSINSIGSQNYSRLSEIWVFSHCSKMIFAVLNFETAKIPESEGFSSIGVGQNIFRLLE